MIRHRLAGLIAGGLLFLAGSAVAESVTGPSAAADPAAANTHDGAASGVWGDPEDQSTPEEPGWTWFGMGYERRTRDTSADVTSTPDKTDDGPGNGGKGK